MADSASASSPLVIITAESAASPGTAGADATSPVAGTAALQLPSSSSSAASASLASPSAGKAGKAGGGKVSASQRRALEAAERRKAEQVSAEVARAQSLASARWNDCLQCLSSSLPLLSANPYLCILQPPFLYDYLDSLTETLANLSAHSADLHAVRALLQSVYASFVELGRFAKYQPAFFFDDPASLRRFMRLLEQVSHKNSDKALYPNILSLLTPTFSRVELYPLLAELGLLRCLLAFTVNGWIPSLHTSLMLFAIVEEMAGRDDAVRAALQQEPGWERLCKLCWGREAGLSKEQQQRGQQALAWAEPDLPDDWKAPHGAADDGDEDDDDANAAAAAPRAQLPTAATNAQPQPQQQRQQQPQPQPLAQGPRPPEAVEDEGRDGDEQCPPAMTVGVRDIAHAGGAGPAEPVPAAVAG